MQKSRMPALIDKIVLAIAAVGFFAFGYHWGNRYAAPKMQDLWAYALPNPVKITHFQLMDKNGLPFTEADFNGYWNWIMAGNLEDPGCKTLLMRYVMAWNYLATQPKLQNQTRVVFMETNHLENPPQALKKAIEFYNPVFTAITGPPRKLQALGQQLGMKKALNRSCRPDSAIVALVGPNGYLQALFTGVTDAHRIAQDLRFFSR